MPVWGTRRCDGNAAALRLMRCWGKVTEMTVSHSATAKMSSVVAASGRSPSLEPCLRYQDPYLDHPEVAPTRTESHPGPRWVAPLESRPTPSQLLFLPMVS